MDINYKMTEADYKFMLDRLIVKDDKYFDLMIMYAKMRDKNKKSLKKECNVVIIDSLPILDLW